MPAHLHNAPDAAPDRPHSGLAQPSVRRPAGSRAQVALLVVVFLGALASGFSQNIDPYYLDVLMSMGIAVTLAVSLNLVTGFTGQFSLGHAGFMSIGAYLSAGITTQLAPQFFGAGGGLANAFTQGSFFLGALLLGGLGAALAGLCVGGPSLRLKGDYLALVTLGFGEIIRVVFQNTAPLGGALGLNGIPPYTSLFWVITWAALTVFVVHCLVHSTYGRGFIATHDDEIAAESIGLNTTRYKIVAFMVGAFFAGIAGGLYAHFRLSIVPTGFDFSKSIEVVLIVILGGMGNTVGVILAAILLTLLPELLRPIAEYRMVLYSLLLIVLMVWRPRGLFNLNWTALGRRARHALLPTKGGGPRA